MGLNLNPLDAAKNVAGAIGDAAGKGADAFGDAVTTAKNAVAGMSASDIGHMALDGVGMVPVVGEVADLANGAWYGIEGDWANAALSAGAAIPVVGNAATGAKWVKRGADAVDAVADGAKALDRAKDGAKLADDAADARKLADDVPAKKTGKGDEPEAPAKVGELKLITRTQGANRMEWNVDAQGRFVSGKAQLSEDFAGRKTRGSAETAAQKEAASRGVKGDQGGHMFAHRFVKDQGSINLVPQNGDLNNKAWGQMEQEWGDWIKADNRVDVSITASPTGKDRPDAFRVTYDVVDPGSGKTVYKNSVRFENEAGQTFDRVSARDMKTRGEG